VLQRQFGAPRVEHVLPEQATDGSDDWSDVARLYVVGGWPMPAEADVLEWGPEP
jgi:hypothetical protein